MAMGWLRFSAMAFTLVFICIVLICVCGNPSRNDPLGVLNRFLTRTLPAAIKRFLKATRTEWIIDVAYNVYAWFFLQRNPFVMIGYFILILGGFGVFLWKAYPRIPNDYIAAWHKPIGIGVMLACLSSFIAAAAVHPGHITKDTVARYARWKFDNILFDKRVCATCDVVKPARSKHCKIMNQCISRFDHYCIWLNTAVGERNYRYFLAFLVTHVIMLWYGGIAALSIFAQEAADKRLWEATFVRRGTNERIKASTWIVVQFLMHENYELSMCFMLCAVMGLVLAGFTGYHLYLTACNLTTNEMMKWGDVERGQEYNRRRHELAVKNVEPIRSRVADVQAKVSAARAALDSVAPAAPGAPAGPRRTLSSSAAEADTEELQRQLEVHEERLKDLQEIQSEMEEALANPPPDTPLTHAYDRGVWQNFMEALFPLSDRGAGALPAHPMLAGWGEEDVQPDADTQRMDEGGTMVPPASKPADPVKQRRGAASKKAKKAGRGKGRRS